MKKIILTSSASIALGLASLFISLPAAAQPAFALYLGVYPVCTGCHSTQNGGKNDLLPGVMTAYMQDPINLTGLQTYLNQSSTSTTPTVPTCTNGQVLNAAQTACITPVPTCTNGQVLNAAQTACIIPVPTCTNGQVLNATKTACITPVPTCTNGQVLNATKTACVTPVPTCANGQVLNATKTACVTPVPTCTNGQVLNATKTACVAANTPPVLNAIATQWDAQVGQQLSIPLSVKDAQQDAFTMFGTVSGSTFSKVASDAKTLLPTVDFLWTPTAAQADKIYTVSFYAQETNTSQHYTSNKETVSIRVWPAGSRAFASITKLNVATSVWKSGKLSLSGNVVFNSILTPQELSSYIAAKYNLNITRGNTGTGSIVATTPLQLLANGNWSATLSIAQAQVPCSITLQFEGQNASRTVTGAPATCLK